MRKGDGHLLAVGDDTFISDGRFQAQRIAASVDRPSDTWTLQIRLVQPQDAGDYECQVSSNEPKISRVIRLRAVGELLIHYSSFVCVFQSHSVLLKIHIAPVNRHQCDFFSHWCRLILL